MSTTNETYQQGIMNLQGWLDFLDTEKARLDTQLVRMQSGSQSLPEVDADLPYMDAELRASADSANEDDEAGW